MEAMDQTPKVEPSDDSTMEKDLVVLQQSEAVDEPIVPRKKQRRKSPLEMKPLSDKDINLEFLIIEEPSPSAPEVEVKRKPRKEYRTKKKARLELISSEEPKETPEESAEKIEKNKKTKKPDKVATEPSQESPAKPTPETPPSKANNAAPQPKQSPTRVKQSPQQPTSERRTRLSNACRVATGNSYKCTDCDFSTARINNIVLHMKESCPNIKREK